MTTTRTQYDQVFHELHELKLSLQVVHFFDELLMLESIHGFLVLDNGCRRQLVSTDRWEHDRFYQLEEEIDRSSQTVRHVLQCDVVFIHIGFMEII